MKRTVDEKYKYNQSRKDTFSTGYCTGVNLYRSYTKSDGETKAMIKEIITTSKEATTSAKVLCVPCVTVPKSARQNNAADKLSFIGNASRREFAPRRGYLRINAR